MKINLILIIVVFLFSCSKSASISNDNSGSQVQQLLNDGLSMPLKKGNSWKYQRFDTSVYQIFGADTALPLSTYKTDSSEEIINVSGDTLISSIDPVNRLYIVLIQNTGRSTTDTNFILYTKDRFNVYGHLVSLKASFFSPPSAQVTLADFESISTKSNKWDLLTSVSLPITNTPFRINRIFSEPRYLPYKRNDTVCTRSDTSILVAGTLYFPCVLANYAISTMGIGQNQIGGGFYEYTSVIKPGLGIVFSKQYPDLSSGGLNSIVYTTSWITRILKSAVIL